MHKADRWKIEQNPQRVLFNQFTKVLLRRALSQNRFSRARRNALLYRMMRPREGFKGWGCNANIVNKKKTSASSVPNIHFRWRSPR